jgi:hypothetical protein
MSAGPEASRNLNMAEAEALYCLTLRLPSSKPTRQLVLKFMGGASLSEEEITTLLIEIAEPSGFRWREQLLAVTLLGFLPLDRHQRASLYVRLKNICDMKAWPDYQTLFTLRFLPLWFLFAVWLLSLGAPVLLGLIASAIPTIVIMLPASGIWEDGRMNCLRAAALRTCGRLRLLDSLGMVNDALFYAPGLEQTRGCHQVRQAALEALPLMASALTPEDYGQVPSDFVPNLCRALYHPDDAIVILVLDALAKVGDGRAVKPVARMVERGRTPELCAAAARILPILEERERLEAAPHILLRASEPPAVKPEELLRPAAVGSETEPATLLRAGAPPE